MQAFGLRHRLGGEGGDNYRRVPTDATDTSGDMTRLIEQGQPRPDLLTGKGTISDRLRGEEERRIKNMGLFVTDKNPMSRVVKRIKEGALNPLYNDLKNSENEERIQEVLGMDMKTYKVAMDSLKKRIDKRSSHKVWNGKDKVAQARAYDAIAIHIDILENVRYRLQNDIPDKGRLDDVSIEYAKSNIDSSHRSLLILHHEVSQGMFETAREIQKFSDNPRYNCYRKWMKATHDVLIEGYDKHFKSIEKDFEAFDNPNKPNRQDLEFMRAVEFMQNITTVLLAFEQGVRKVAKSVDSPEECLPKLAAFEQEVHDMEKHPENE